MEIALFILGIFITSLGQILLKEGVTKSNLTLSHRLVGQIISNKFLFSGFVLYGVGAIVWLFILKKLPLSIAYPAVSLSYVVVIILSSFIFKEQITNNKLIAIFFIFVGLFFLAKQK